MKKVFGILMLALALPMGAWSQTYILPINDGVYDVKYYYSESSPNILAEPESDAQGWRWTELEYDDSDWNSYSGTLSPDGLFSVTGTYYVRKRFNLNNVEELNYYLHSPDHNPFGGFKCWINGSYIGEAQHQMCLPISPTVLKVGENVISLGIWAPVEQYPTTVWFGIFKDTNYWGLDNICYPTIMTDVTNMSNVIYAEPIEWTYDESERNDNDWARFECNVPLKMKNSNDVANYQFSIIYPGVSYLEATLIENRHDGHTISTQDGTTFVIMSLDGGEISGNDGEIVNLKIGIPETSVARNNSGIIFPLRIYNAVYTMSDGRRIGMPDVWLPITVKYPESGDANGDKEVDIADVVSIVNTILGSPTAVHLERAADTNNDGYVDISDAQIVLNRVLRRTARQANSDPFDLQ